MLELVTILTDCQAAIGRMTSDEPGPGQKKALEARRHIATLRAKEPNVKVEIRWCPSHKGIDGNEIADEWAKLAADESDAHGVEWLSTTNPDGTVSESLPVPEVLRQRQARVLRKEMAGRQRLGQEEACPHQQPQIPAKRKAETGPNGGQGQQAPRLPVLPAEDGTLPHWAIPRVDDPPPRRYLLVVSVRIQTREYLFKTAPNGRVNRRLSG